MSGLEEAWHNGIGLKLVLGVLTVLIAAGVIGMWSMNRELAVISTNVSALVKDGDDREERLRELERRQRPPGQ